MSYGGGGETMNELTQDDCKLITEWLGECWHNKFINDGREGLRSLKRCRYCDSGEKNRTFQDPQDFFACFDKMKAREDWPTFKHFVWENWCRAVENNETEEQGDDYILSRTESGHYRLCMLCAEWLKAQGTVVEWRQATDKTTWS
jgi:hypothetical protein